MSSETMTPMEQAREMLKPYGGSIWSAMASHGEVVIGESWNARIPSNLACVSAYDDDPITAARRVIEMRRAVNSHADLLAACENFANAYAEQGPHVRIAEKWFLAALAAIAKAHGEKPVHTP